MGTNLRVVHVVPHLLDIARKMTHNPVHPSRPPLFTGTVGSLDKTKPQIVGQYPTHRVNCSTPTCWLRANVLEWLKAKKRVTSPSHPEVKMQSIPPASIFVADASGSASEVQQWHPKASPPWNGQFSRKPMNSGGPTRHTQICLWYTSLTAMSNWINMGLTLWKHHESTASHHWWQWDICNSSWCLAFVEPSTSSAGVSVSTFTGSATSSWANTTCAHRFDVLEVDFLKKKHP